MFDKLIKFLKANSKVVISCCCGAVVVLSVVLTITLTSQPQTPVAEEPSAEPTSVVAIVQTPAPTQTAQPTPSPTPTSTPDRVIDFAGLQEQNEEIYAWINIPGTNVDYPVVHTNDNSFYLTHDAMLNSTHDGALFIDAVNSTDFSDTNTTIYGHRMNSGNMFGELYYYIEKEYFDSHKILKIYTPDNGMSEYEIFAAYETDDSYIPSRFDFYSEAGMQEFLASMGSTDDEANITPLMLTTEDKILTLSTCVKDQDTRRYLIHAVLRPDGVQTDIPQATQYPLISTEPLTQG